MKTNATFYHAGCPVCLDAQNAVHEFVDTATVDLEIVHLGEDRSRLDAAKAAGVKSVPALVLGADRVLHINHGADLSALG